MQPREPTFEAGPGFVRFSGTVGDTVDRINMKSDHNRWRFDGHKVYNLLKSPDLIPLFVANRPLEQSVVHLPLLRMVQADIVELTT